jgi:hypothetical protein
MPAAGQEKRGLCKLEREGFEPAADACRQDKRAEIAAPRSEAYMLCRAAGVSAAGFKE